MLFIVLCLALLVVFIVWSTVFMVLPVVLAVFHCLGYCLGFFSRGFVYVLGFGFIVLSWSFIALSLILWVSVCYRASVKQGRAMKTSLSSRQSNAKQDKTMNTKPNP